VKDHPVLKEVQELEISMGRAVGIGATMRAKAATGLFNDLKVTKVGMLSGLTKQKLLSKKGVSH